MRQEKPTILSAEEWISREKKHAALVTPLADAFLRRRGLGLKHPVHDFLFTYYTCSPQKLKQWIPSFEEALVITPELRELRPWLIEYWFKEEGGILSINREQLQDSTRSLAKFIAELCENILAQPARFGCFGLHEWAMVYQLSPQDLRHKNQRLRLPSAEIDSFVKSQTLCCTHYDAYRFFTPEARPLNILTPNLDTRLQMEQGGCIHANMDLYKWATKLWPWLGSDFIAKTFLHAHEGRELDMRASPYDLSEIGYSPICIETEEGRKQYQLEQQLYAEKAVLLRQELGSLCRRLEAVKSN